MAVIGKLLFGASVGAALMYLYDPERGVRRRAGLRNQALSARARFREAADTTIQDTRNRAGRLRWPWRLSRHNASVGDDVLTERVRTVVGQGVSRPGAIDIVAIDGDITLSGHVLTGELPLLIDWVYDIPGVKAVHNRLQMHPRSENVPELQGARAPARRHYSFGFFQNNWSRAARMTAGLAGAGGILYGLAGRGASAKLIGAGGAALLARAATNLDLVRLTGIRKRYSIHVEKSIRIDAPVERVFEVWADNTHFPHFMTHVREVHALDDGAAGGARRWHWKVRGASGFETEFDSQTTAYEQDRFLAWRSEPGALVQHAGYVRFRPQSGDRSTLVEIRLSYTPPAGAIGHAIAKMLGDDPKSQMDDDLRRMKEYIETGRPPRDAAAGQPTRSARPQPEF